MKNYVVICLLSFMVSGCVTTPEPSMEHVVDYALNRAVEQYKHMYAVMDSIPEMLPRSVDKNGGLETSDSYFWTSGFYPGTLWYLYEYTGDEQLKDMASRMSDRVEIQKYNKDNHDVGFMINCSFGNKYRLLGDTSCIDIITTTARSLSTRYRSAVGCTRSWSHPGTLHWQFPVIIDNMMNLELMFEATRLSGDSTFYDIARKHADTTMANHFRADNSCYHVVDYDPETGEVRKKQTAQGYADESAWARGQAWALYGYTMCYRYTHDVKYLEQAEKIYGFIFNNKNLPEDLVPYWDFDAPKIPDEPRDASAAACTASALYELSTYIPGKGYKEKADKIMESLASPAYRAEVGTNGNFILMHSVGSIPHGAEIDVPLNYADYYFLEALMRKRDLEK